MRIVLLVALLLLVMSPDRSYALKCVELPTTADAYDHHGHAEFQGIHRALLRRSSLQRVTLLHFSRGARFSAALLPYHGVLSMLCFQN